MMTSSSSSSDLSSADHHLLQDDLPWPSSLPFPHTPLGLGLGGQWSHPALMQLEQLSSDELEALLLSAHHNNHSQQQLLAAAPTQLSSLLMMQELGFQWSSCPAAGTDSETPMLITSQQQDAALKEEEELPESSSLISNRPMRSAPGISYNDTVDIDGAVVLPSVNVSRLTAAGGGDAFEMSTSSPARLCRSLVSCGQFKQGASSSAVLVHNGGNGVPPLLREHYGGPPAHRLQALPSIVHSYSKMGVAAALVSENNGNAHINGSCHDEQQMQVAISKTKKPRLDSTTIVPSFKVRKEKLGDRIAALQQLVSPFGKTDTASVLMEAIGYIKFLQDQVETLSGPYMQRSSRNKKARTTPQRGPSSNVGDSKQQVEVEARVVDLRSRGLCLVPLSCTSYVTNENAIWPPPNFRGN